MKNTIRRDFKLKTFPLLSQLEHWREEAISIPLFTANVQCGLFGISDDHLESSLSIDQRFVKNKEASFFMRAQGNSMEPVIFEDDYLLIDRSITEFQNRVCVLDLNGERMCKFRTRINGSEVLHSFNPNVKDIILTGHEEIQTFGVVTIAFKELTFESINKCTRL